MVSEANVRKDSLSATTGLTAQVGTQVQLPSRCIHTESDDIIARMESTLVRLQVTHTVLATPAVREQIGRLKTAFGKTTLDLLEFFTTSYREVFKFEHPPVHDPVAVVYVVQPELFKSEMMRVDVETSSSLSSGQTVCDVWHQSDRPNNVTVVHSVDVDACWDIILDSVKRCDASSTLNK